MKVAKDKVGLRYRKLVLYLYLYMVDPGLGNRPPPGTHSSQQGQE